MHGGLDFLFIVAGRQVPGFHWLAVVIFITTGRDSNHGFTFTPPLSFHAG